MKWEGKCDMYEEYSVEYRECPMTSPKPAKAWRLENGLESRVWSRRCWYSGGAKEIKLSRTQNGGCSVEHKGGRVQTRECSLGCRMQGR